MKIFSWNLGGWRSNGERQPVVGRVSGIFGGGLPIKKKKLLGTPVNTQLKPLKKKKTTVTTVGW